MSPEGMLISKKGQALKPSKQLDVRQEVFKGLRVLVVDDAQSNHDVVKIFLAPVGCEITHAYNGQEAVNATQHGHFDVILMDIRMPVMNGIVAMQVIKKQGPRQAAIPIITMTADTSAENNAECIAAGAGVFLTKPVVTSELFGAISFVVKKSKATKAKEDVLSEGVLSEAS